ncbi:MAG: hypothetical protein DRI61_11040 [Chloroflexi bacterium]|nr:MAG: hypothetical protein DRI61_11040 [Chloroflexota bacterium]
MDALAKLKILEDVYPDKADLELMVNKLVDATIGQYRLRLKRYEQELRDFEQRYGMDSATFYRRFEAGELGDAMDFFEWAGLYELHQDLLEKLKRLESIV